MIDDAGVGSAQCNTLKVDEPHGALALPFISDKIAYGIAGLGPLKHCNCRVILFLTQVEADGVLA